MKTRIFGLALMLSVAAAMGACENTTNTTPTGEPTDTGAATPAATTPAATTTAPATTKPAATPTTTP